MNDSPKFDPLQFEIIKKAIPFVVDDTAEWEDDADLELDFSIADIDEYTESESETVEQNFREQGALRLSHIYNNLTAWRTNGITADILDDISREFYALKEGAVSAGFDDVSRLSHVVVRLLEQSDASISNDSSLLNLLEEMHDGLAANLELIPITGEDHIRSLISMVQLLLTDDSVNPIATKSEVLEYSDSDQARSIEHADSGYNLGCVEEQATQTQADPLLQTPPLETTISQVLLVKVGTCRVALLIPDIERVMRVHENEIQALNGQHHVTLAERPIRVVNLAMCLGETNIRADDGVRLLVVSCLSDGIVADRMIAFEVDKFQEVAEVVVKTVGSQFASIGGMVGVAVLADDSLVLIPDLQQLSKQVFSEQANDHK